MKPAGYKLSEDSTFVCGLIAVKGSRPSFVVPNDSNYRASKNASTYNFSAYFYISI